jgi:hypothetical protein
MSEQLLKSARLRLTTFEADLAYSGLGLVALTGMFVVENQNMLVGRHRVTSQPVPNPAPGRS